MGVNTITGSIKYLLGWIESSIDLEIDFQNISLVMEGKNLKEFGFPIICEGEINNLEGV
jgi:hypothetical protein